ncbi:MAG: dienelactone hydrolase family protein [Candidatus Omnitrophica bacterium]|nr:dienelactone hydrolase family protein [Candidatus Omnitrophota bacterium]
MKRVIAIYRWGLILITGFVLLFLPKLAQAEIHAETIEYKDGEVILEGYLAYDDSIKEKRPGVLVVHEWTGINDYIKQRVNQLAEEGYIAFAADIYGKSIRPQNKEEAAKQAGIYRADRKLMRRRVQAGLACLKKNPITDPSRIAAIGYCFGGGVVLELARSGADVEGVVSFHGNLDTPNPEDAGMIKAKVLVLHGADDPHVPMRQVKDFEREMDRANVDWRMVSYKGAVHSFTNPASGNDPSTGAAYNKEADMNSWKEMIAFFNKIFHDYNWPLEAMANITDTSGKEVGKVLFRENEGRGVTIDLKLHSFLPGRHAFHIHEFPVCDAPDFKSAGGHFNPYGKQHGFLNEKGHHAGDLPNIIVEENGNCQMSFTTTQITLRKDKENSILRKFGTSLVIHELPDDYFTDPAGGGGKRLACGTIKEVEVKR